MDTLTAGQHIKVSRSRGIYMHHGIYVGNNQVIHHSGFSEAFKKGAVEQTSLESFLGGYDSFQIIRYPSHQEVYSPEEIVVRALSCLGEDNYNLIFNNCEHFACWCVTGKKRSEQVQAVMRQTCTAILSYSLVRSELITTSGYITTTMSPSTASGGTTLASTALKSSLSSTNTGAFTTTGSASIVGTVARGALSGATSIASAPVTITVGVISGLFSLFK